MTAHSPLQSLTDTTQRTIVGFGLAVIALVAFNYGATVLATATATTPVPALALGAFAMLVCVGALAWLGSLLLQGARQS